MASGKKVTLPGGRGELTSAGNVQNENFRQRGEEAAQTQSRGWSYSTAPSTHGCASMPTYNIYLSAVPELMRDLRATKATTRMNALAAGHTAQIALYTMELVPLPTFVQVRGTKIILNANLATSQTIDLGGTASIPAGRPLFVGAWVSNAVPRLSGSPCIEMPFQVWRLEAATGGLLERMPVAHLTKVESTNVYTPWVTYYSADAARIY